MENLEVTKQTMLIHRHHFYCDKCNEYLGASEEYDDGWYYPHGDFELKYFLDGSWYRLNKCFCDDCKSEFVDDFKATLENMGFKKD